MKIHEAYTIYNNGIQSIDPQLSEAINCILDQQNAQLEKLDRVELAEFKARIEIEAMEGYYIARLKRADLQIADLWTALKTAKEERDIYKAEAESWKLTD